MVLTSPRKRPGAEPELADTRDDEEFSPLPFVVHLRCELVRIEAVPDSGGIGVRLIERLSPRIPEKDGSHA